MDTLSTSSMYTHFRFSIGRLPSVHLKETSLSSSWRYSFQPVYHRNFSLFPQLLKFFFNKWKLSFKNEISFFFFCLISISKNLGQTEERLLLHRCDDVSRKCAAACVIIFLGAKFKLSFISWCVFKSISDVICIAFCFVVVSNEKKWKCKYETEDE